MVSHHKHKIKYVICKQILKDWDNEISLLSKEVNLGVLFKMSTYPKL